MAKKGRKIAMSQRMDREREREREEADALKEGSFFFLIRVIHPLSCNNQKHKQERKHVVTTFYYRSN